jgi:excisionase family DNA binding protein
MSRHLDALFDDLPARLNVAQVADLLGVSHQAVHKWVRTGVVPAYKIGGTWVILREDLKDVMEAGSNTATSDDGPDTSD